MLQQTGAGGGKGQETLRDPTHALPFGKPNERDNGIRITIPILDLQPSIEHIPFYPRPVPVPRGEQYSAVICRTTLPLNFPSLSLPVLGPGARDGRRRGPCCSLG